MKKLLPLFFLLSFTIEFFAQSIGEPKLILSGEDKFLSSPKFSPDGNYLAFTQDNYTGIQVLNISSGQVKIITDEPAGFGFSWSPDSKYILTRTAKFKNNKRTDAVKTFNVRTNESTIISDYQSNLNSLPQWSGNGKYVVIAQKNELKKTIVRGFENERDELIRDETTLILDGTRLAICNADNQLKYITPIKDAEYLNLALSPDKSMAAFEVYGGNLYVMKANGNGLTDLGKGERPAWSPDGKYIAYTITTDDGHKYISSEIYKVKSDGTEKLQITNTSDILEMNPCWSPDGKKIVFNDVKSGAIYSIELSK